MRIFYKSHRKNDNSAVEYELVGQPLYCCVRMAHEWGQLIGFGFGERFPRTSDMETYIRTIHMMSRGETITGITDISHCP